MRPVFVDSGVRRQVLLAATCGVAATAACALLVTLLPPGTLSILATAAVVGCVLAGVGAMGLVVQQGLLERPVALTPGRIARWSGTMLATIAGPLVTAKLLVGAIALLGGFMAESQGAGAYAGVGVAWLILPMALLVTGTAALKLPAVAADAPIDTGEAIRLADGREWSLVPLGIALTIAFLLLAAGALFLAMGLNAGQGVLPGLVLIPIGTLCFLPACAALARRWQRLHA